VTAEVRGARLTFHAGTPNEVRALDGVDLSISEGSFAVVIGTNGSGKSTLLNALAGSLALDGGSILLDGRDVTRLPEHRRAAFVGRVFQNPFTGTAPGMTIAENLAIAARRGSTRGLKWALGKSLKKELSARVASLGMGLEQRLETPIGTLSGGQRQALTLLMATWHRPRLLLLDEHTAALDPKTAEQVLALTASIVSSAKLTTLMVTHSMAQAVTMGNRLVMMARGRVLHDFEGALKERLRADDLLARFEELGREERLDEGLAAQLRASYV
jgi:putative tryptophan/tyrosine transport system ATP-binding protein